MDDARLRGQRGEFERGFRHGKIDQRIGILDDGERVRARLYAERRGKPGQRSEIGSDMGRAFRLDTAREGKPLRLGDEADQRPAHAAARARHGDPDVLSHVGAPFLLRAL